MLLPNSSNAEIHPDSPFWRPDPIFLDEIRATAHQLDSLGAASSQTALHQISYPKDRTEYERMGGHGLLRVTVLAHDPEDLVIREVYAQADTVGVAFKLVAAHSSHSAAEDGVVTRTLGGFRSDAIYLFPVLARLVEADLYVEFGQEPLTFLLEQFPGTPPPEVVDLPKGPPLGLPDPTALTRMLERDFPDFRGRRMSPETASEEGAGDAGEPPDLANP